MMYLSIVHLIIFIFIYANSPLIICTLSLKPQDPVDGVTHQQHRLSDNHQHHQSLIPYGARSTQFMINTGNQPASPSAYSRGALIMPPNNPIQTPLNSPYSSNFQVYNETPNSALPSIEPLNSGGTRAIGSPSMTVKSFNYSQNRPESVTARGLAASSLELALRQASTDESVFQPLPMIGAPEPNFDWIPQISNQQQQTTESSLTTTEQNNNIAQNEVVSTPTSIHQQTPMLDSQSSLGSLHNEHMSQSATSFSSIINGAVAVDSNLTSSTNRNADQTFYEGPATAPPSGDYYFSSSEKHPNREKASNVWWALGVGKDYERASNLSGTDYLDYCMNSELLVSSKQRTLCRSHPKIMVIVARGLKMAIDECQTRFTSSRWNCSLVLQDSLLTSAAHRAQVFGEVMKQPNRERSFLNAILAAGLAHAMTKACSQNELPEECSCDKKIRTKSNKGIEWVACSDDIDFGARFSRDFTDNTDNESDTTAMINMHNYEVGRRVFKSATDITCTCSNGENGLCKTKRCWKHLGSFNDVGEELMRRYESATHVQLSSKDPHKLRPVKRGVRRPKRKDLVYIDESPDYCNAHPRIGVLGTQNRRCNSTSSGSDSCSLLCCGRGYQVVVEEIEEDCNCKFVWCCQVKCDKCKRHITSDVCN